MATTAATRVDLPADDLDWLDAALADDFPKPATSAAPLPCPPRPSRGVRLDDAEEAARYGVALTLPYSDPATAAEHYAAWDAYDAYQAAMSRWIDGRGPRPE